MNVVSKCLFLAAVCACILSDAVTAREDGKNNPDESTLNLRHEYKWSLKGPFYSPEKNVVPFWEVYENAMVSEKEVRLVPSVNNRKGSIWNVNPTSFDQWEVMVKFSIYGRSQSGADGLAIWYTKERSLTGPIFGTKDRWNGIGLFVDTYDNDGKRDNPSLYAVMGDGKKEFDHNHDGGEDTLGRCRIHARNSINPVTIRMSYIDKTLTVSVDETSSNKYFEPCFKVENIELPSGYFFGVSAATGGLADDHVLHSFQTFSRRTGEQDTEKMAQAEVKLSLEEQEKFNRMFHDQQSNLHHKQEEYIAKHKDDPATLEFDVDNQEVFWNQGQAFDSIATLQKQLNTMFQYEMKEMGAVLKENHMILLKQMQNIKASGATQDGSTANTDDTKQLERLVSSVGIKVDSLFEKIEALEHKYGQLQSGLMVQQQSGHAAIKNAMQEETLKMKEQVVEGSSFYYWAVIILVIAQIVCVSLYVCYKWKADSASKKFI
eukprot:CFRG4244T1